MEFRASVRAEVGERNTALTSTGMMITFFYIHTDCTLLWYKYYVHFGQKAVGNKTGELHFAGYRITNTAIGHTKLPT